MKKKLMYLILFAGINSFSSYAQSSYDTDFVGIGGTDCAAFGFQALNPSVSGPGNTGTGHSALFNITSGEFNTARGMESLFNNTGGNQNVGLGYRALFNNNGDNNTATGHSALFSNSSGAFNVAHGMQALYSNSSGNANTALGYNALFSNDGSYNTAAGHGALYSNSSGDLNVAIGKDSQLGNMGGLANIGLGFNSLSGYGANNFNIGVGVGALQYMSSGDLNIAVGEEALQNNSFGAENIAFGLWGMQKNTQGNNNIAVGLNALHENHVSSSNIAIGASALYNHDVVAYYSSGNVAVGDVALHFTETRHTTGIGYYSLITALPNSGSSYNGNSTCGALANLSSTFKNATAIGYHAIVTGNDRIRLGDVNVTTVESKVAIFTTSDGRFKFDVSEKDIKGLEFITKLRPVVYNFDTEKFQKFLCKNMADSIQKMYLKDDFKKSTASRQSGFIAQEVEKAAKAADYGFNGINRPSDENDHYGLSYDMFVVPLVKAVQEQQQLLEEQKKVNTELQNEIDERNQLLATLQGSQQSELEPIFVFQPGFNLQLANGSKVESPVLSYVLPRNTAQAYLAVYDLNGKQIERMELTNKTNGTVELPSDKLSAGIYICSVLSENKILGSCKTAIGK